ncbi:MAG: hypothetical protein RI946_2191 [Pseudomonadota bacterium]
MTEPRPDTDMSHDVANELMEQVGVRVRRARTAKSLSRRELSEIADVSPRYIAQMEAGQGNISIVLLSRVAHALEIGIEWLLWPEDPWFSPVKDIVDRYRVADRQTRERILRILDDQDAPNAKASRICLIGLRGAGKSTLGRLVAKVLDTPFIELNQVIQDLGGMPISEIMALYGPEGYRQFEADALNHIKDTYTSVIVAAAGGVVGETSSFDVILANFHSIWVKASPKEHMERVLAQGDTRPMAGQPQAMAQLEKILASREASYAKSDYTLDTSKRSLETSCKDLLHIIKTSHLIPAQANP